MTESRIAFDRWDAVINAYERWWDRSLRRPLVNLAVVEPQETAVRRLGPPPLELRDFTGSYLAAVTPEQIVDCWDWHLARRRYVADGFPTVLPNFGPGVLAAFMGARMECRPDTIWFEPPGEVLEPQAIRLAFDPDNPAFRRVASVDRAAVEFWRGGVQVSMTDLGGNLDIVQTFRPGDLLATDLYDHPQEIKRITWEVHSAWHTAFDALQAIRAGANPGYTAWTPLLSQESYYMLQCDFCYMVGPGMFDEFVKPELVASCRRIARPFYHLDGKGQLPHLPSLLAIPELKGVQWVPGDGSPDIRHWPEVYRRITEAGKLIQVFVGQCATGLKILDVLRDQIGSLDHVAVIGEVEAGAAEEDAREVLNRHGVPW